MESPQDTSSTCDSPLCRNQSTGELSKTLSLLESSGIFCRICHEGEGNEELIRPCKCSGSLQFVHHSCLLSWISRCGDLQCEICKHRYQIQRVPKQRFLEWKLPPIGVKGWLHIILFFAFLAMFLTSVIWIIWSQTSSSRSALIERTSSEIKYAYILNGIFIITALVGMLVDSVRQFRRYFQRLLALNQEYAVKNYTPMDPASEYKSLSRSKRETCCALDNGRLLDDDYNIQSISSISPVANSSITIETCV